MCVAAGSSCLAPTGTAVTVTSATISFVPNESADPADCFPTDPPSGDDDDDGPYDPPGWRSHSSDETKEATNVEPCDDGGVTITVEWGSFSGGSLSNFHHKVTAQVSECFAIVDEDNRESPPTNVWNFESTNAVPPAAEKIFKLKVVPRAFVEGGRSWRRECDKMRAGSAAAGGGAGPGSGPGGTGGASSGSTAPTWSDSTAVSTNTAVGLGGAIPLGSSTNADGGSAGVIKWSLTSIGADTYTPALLGASVADGVDVVYSGSDVRQVHTGTTLADVVATGASAFQVRFYTNAAGFATNTEGIYQVGGATALTTWTFENPTPSTTDSLRIIRDEGGVQQDVTKIGQLSDGWRLYSQMDGSGEFARLETRTTAIEPGTGYSNIVETIHVVDPRPSPDALVSETVRTYRDFEWGRELVREIQDPSGANRVTEWTYHGATIPNTPNYGKVASVIYPDGNWAIHTNYITILETTNIWEYYPFETNIVQDYVLVEETWQPWKDIGMGQAAPNTCRRTVKTYDGAMSEPLRAVTNQSVYVEGHLIEKTETLAPLNADNSVNHDKTNLLYWGTGESARLFEMRRWAGGTMVFSSLRDGRRDTFRTENGFWNETNATFSTSTNDGSVRTFVTHGTDASTNGVAYRTTRQVSTRAADGRTVLEEEQVYDGTGYATISSERHFYDADGERIRTERDGRVTHEETWEDIRLLSEADESGAVTTYGYDAYGRRYQETRAGVTTTYGYDTEGRVASITRSAGGPSLLSSTTLYPTGEIASQTDEAGLTTSYAYGTSASGGRVETVTLPSGATRITEYHRDGQLKMVHGTGAVHEYHEYDAFDGGRWEKVYFGSTNNTSARWTKTYYDMLGRITKEERPGYTGDLTTHYHYDPATGRLLKKQEPGLADRLFVYDGAGQLWREGLDLGNAGSLDDEGTDRITETDRFYDEDGGDWYRVNARRTFLTDSSATATTLAETREQLTGLSAATMSRTLSFDAFGQTAVQTTTVDRETATVTSTTDTRDSNINAVMVTVNGRLVSASTPTVAAATQYLYDGLGRPWKVIEPTGATTEYGYTGGQLTSIKDPANNTVTMAYHGQGQSGAGQMSSRTHPGGATETFAYDALGNLTLQTGTAAYPVSYGFDAYGQMTTMTTYRDGYPGTGDTTTWNYQSSTGLLSNKTYASGPGISYIYNDLGRVATRTSGRDIDTTYGYNAAGDQTWIDYSDATPSVTNGYDRAGRLISVSDAAGTRGISLTADGKPDDEGVQGGILSGLGIVRNHDDFGRVIQTGSFLDGGAIPIGTLSRHYRGDGRLMDIGGTGYGSAIVGYQANSDRIGAIAFPQKLTRVFGYDAAGRLVNVQQRTPNWQTLVGHGYAVDARGRRTRADREDGTHWEYWYNDRSEVIRGKRKFDETTFMPGSWFEYDFDGIGNRTEARWGGNLSGGDWTSEFYTIDNPLNQIDGRSYPSDEWITGEAAEAAEVKVNGAVADRHGKFFWKKVANGAGAAATVLSVNIEARVAGAGPGGQDIVTTESGSRLIPSYVESMSYDGDGNLTSDSLWTYTWDAENRLRTVTTTNDIPEANRVRLTFDYDSQWRRIQKTVERRQGGSWVETARTKFVWDDWHLIAELDARNGDAPLRSYVWGPDLSGAVGGAGGVGGLLLVRDHATGAVHAPCYDGNGNIVALASMDGTPAVVARYEYGPFGEPLRATGPAAGKCPFRFSTKYTDEETGLVYYGYRHYNPAVGRWLSTDPMEEQGGINLRAFMQNAPTSKVDALGLFDMPPGLRVDIGPGAIPSLIALYITALSGDPWAPEFLLHYFFGMGREKVLSRNRVAMIDANPALLNVRYFQKISESIVAGNSVHVDGDRPFSNPGYTAGRGPGDWSLGQFGAELRGDLCFDKKTRQWTFYGEFRLDDVYDFDPHLGRETNRSKFAEFRVWMMYLFTRGSKYHVTSNWIWTYQDSVNYRMKAVW